MTTAKLQEEIQAAQVIFVTAAFRLLDEAEDVRQHRDRLLKLLDEQASDKAKQGGTDAK